MPARLVSPTDDGAGRIKVELRGRGVWHAFLRLCPDGQWRAWLHQGGLLALSEAEAIAWAERCVEHTSTYDLPHIRAVRMADQRQRLALL